MRMVIIAKPNQSFRCGNYRNEKASQFGELPKDWLKTDQAKEYINIISQKENIPFENLVRTT